MKPAYLLLCGCLACPVLADGTREFEAHEHGVSELNIAIDGHTLTMEIHAPGLDIVGFEYTPQSAKDKAAVEDAVSILSDPARIMTLSAAADCAVIHSEAGLAEEDHSSHGHDDHNHGADHSEFHAKYTLTCANMAGLADIRFSYFDQFKAVSKVRVQIVSAAGAQAIDLTPKTPYLSITDLTN